MEETLEKKRSRASKIFRRLKKTYPDIRCALHFSNPWELLVATILSAQCTDKRVNKVTPILFKRYPKIPDYAGAQTDQLESIIRSTGFYRNKAKNIVKAARVILAKFKEEVPRTMESLVTIPGVGRKTANVVLGNAFGIPGISVDTHMIRLNRLLGFTCHTDPVKIELDLMKIVPRKDWTLFSSLVIHHGRMRCPARQPDCPHCEIAQQCVSAGKDLARISETYERGKTRDNIKKGSRTLI